MDFNHVQVGVVSKRRGENQHFAIGIDIAVLLVPDDDNSHHALRQFVASRADMVVRHVSIVVPQSPDAGQSGVGFRLLGIRSAFFESTQPAKTGRRRRPPIWKTNSASWIRSSKYGLKKKEKFPRMSVARSVAEYSAGNRRKILLHVGFCFYLLFLRCIF